MKTTQVSNTNCSFFKSGWEVGLAREHYTLSAIYHWFTEGFATKDLKEAKARIEELSH